MEPAAFSQLTRRSLPHTQYLGLPGDVAVAACSPPTADSGWLAVPERTSAYWDAVTEAATEAAALLNAAKEPVIVVDLFAARHGVEHELCALLERSGYPCAALLLGKGVVDEHHPQYIGLYSGQRSRYVFCLRLWTRTWTHTWPYTRTRAGVGGLMLSR